MGVFFFLPSLPFFSLCSTGRHGVERQNRFEHGGLSGSLPSPNPQRLCHPKVQVSSPASFFLPYCILWIAPYLTVYVQNGSTISIETFLPRPPHCIIVSCPLSSVLTVPLLGLRIRKIQATELPVLFFQETRRT
ncbi:hypothetical protein CABS01_16097 [Colletotrichum abscissum]|uniref:uncharacterized protein n=1 Tax=Colletotrichum abscissum TaxID=1671311 RepID=UPI0027D4B79C|nr:uncharacterized protein CABS01_16097 [Colletotrichum abscissum]KAK1472954.1 hypothetical protein CABS01_16097 [Colletotrichum abscissum]